jgi:hypothetical protein
VVIVCVIGGARPSSSKFVRSALRLISEAVHHSGHFAAAALAKQTEEIHGDPATRPTSRNPNADQAVRTTGEVPWLIPVEAAHRQRKARW